MDEDDVHAQALAVFGDQALAQEWMRTPLPALGGEAPETLLDSPKGRERVARILRKIEYGEFV